MKKKKLQVPGSTGRDPITQTDGKKSKKGVPQMNMKTYSNQTL